MGDSAYSKRLRVAGTRSRLDQPPGYALQFALREEGRLLPVV